MTRLLIPTLLFSLLSSLTFAHPGEDHSHEAREIQEKRSFVELAGRSYTACSNAEHKRALNDRIAERRNAEIANLRAAVRARKLASSGLERRQDETGAMPSGTTGAGGGQSTTFDSTGEALLNTSHASNRTDITVNSTSAVVFGSLDDTTCLLQPEATIGPYWVSGEYVRDDISEDEAGIPIYMSTQVIDVASCSPVAGLYWEMWHANVSGVYSGVIASGNGDSSDTSNLNNTALRGMYPTDVDGVTTIKSVFPGHYTGRATHVHVVGHTNVTVYENGTIGTGNGGDGESVALHISQLFFDQDLLDEVAQVSPYSENTQTVTENSADNILAALAVEGASDPFFEYVYLGDNVTDGIYAWATVGITTNTSYATSPASVYTEEGGYVNDEAGDLNAGEATYYSYSVASSAASGTTSTAVADAAITNVSSAISGSSSTSTASASTASSNGAARSRPTLSFRPGDVVEGMANHLGALFNNK